MKKLGFVAALTFLALAGTAQAADFGGLNYVGTKDSPSAGQSIDWSGIYVGGGVGYQVGDHELSGGVTGAPFSASIDGLSSRGWSGDGRIGADYQFKGTPLLVGIFGGYNFGSTDFDVNATLGVPLGNVLSMSFEPTWYAGGRVGVIGPWNTLFYAGYAYRQADFDLSFSPTVGPVCASKIVKCSDTVGGHSVLGGIEVPVMQHLTIAAEYSYTRYDSIDLLSPTVKPFHAEMDADVHAFTLRANYKFFGGTY